MSLPTLFELCVPREDVVRGSIAESDFAADLAQVLRGDAPADYLLFRQHPSHAGPKNLAPSGVPTVDRQLSAAFADFPAGYLVRGG